MPLAIPRRPARRAPLAIALWVLTVLLALFFTMMGVPKVLGREVGPRGSPRGAIPHGSSSWLASLSSAARSCCSCRSWRRLADSCWRSSCSAPLQLISSTVRRLGCWFHSSCLPPSRRSRGPGAKSTERGPSWFNLNNGLTTLVLGDKGQDRVRAVLGVTRVPTVRCAWDYCGLCGFRQATDRHFVPVSLRRAGLFSADQGAGTPSVPSC